MLLRKTHVGMQLEQECHLILEMMKTKQNTKQIWLLETDIPKRLSEKDAGGSPELTFSVKFSRAYILS